VDYTELDAASNRGVDEVQALLEQAVYKPVQGRFKVFMIDEVHMLTNTAFNAMLKTLEEPPEYLKFVLATTDPQKVPATVLSRCLQFNLRPMAPQTIREHLQKVLSAEQVSADVQSLKLLARAARGSMRDALSLTDQAISFGSGELMEGTVRQMLGSVDRSYVFRLLDALAKGDGRGVVEISESLRLNGLSAAATLEEMCAVMQRMAILQAVPDRGAATDESDPEGAELVRLASVMPADETQLLYSICLHGRGELGLAPDEYAALTMVLLRLLAFKPASIQNPLAQKKTLIETPLLVVAPAPTVPAVQPIQSRVQPWEDYQNRALKPVEPTQDAQINIAKSGLEHGISLGQQVPVVTLQKTPEDGRFNESNHPAMPVQKAQTASEIVAIPVRVQADSRTESASVQSSAVLVPTVDGDFWHASVVALIASDAITAMVRELALQSQLVARDTDQWLLRVERESLNQSGNRERLTAALVTAGYAVRLMVEIGRVTDSPARRLSAAAAQAQLAAEKIIFDDPFVQGMMREFGAKIVPGSIKPC
jgi:DNA polymerase-3 subunit gamma/tau